MKAPFLDTNILLYTLAEGDRRQAMAVRTLERGGIVSVQVLNEFASAAHRKLKMSWPEIATALTELRTLCATPRPMTVRTHDLGMTLAQKNGFEVYDAMIVAAALEAGCDTLLSDDFQSGLVVDNRLTIRNPFSAA